MNWEILIDKPALTRNLIDRLEEISSCLENDYTTLGKNIGLFGGKTGIALFFFYYSRFTKKESHYDLAIQILSDVVDDVNAGFDAHTLYAGLSGIGWIVEHLAQQKFIEADTPDILKEIDPFVFDAMQGDIQQGNYEFLHGALGTGVYFLNRLETLREDSTGYLIRLVDGLDNISHKEKNSRIKWTSTFGYEREKTGFDLGVAHGIPGIIGFLTLAFSHGIHQEKISLLLNGAVSFLLDQSLDTAIYESHFPSRVGENVIHTASRLGWCYGDPGIGIILWLASQKTGNTDWEKRSIDILEHSARRLDLGSNSVHDACLCHGTAGIAHIFNRMYHYTGIPVFKEQSIYWFDQTLKQARFEDGCAGFKQWYGENQFINKIDFLEGIAGIGLALLSSIAHIEPCWDRCLLLS